MTTPDHVKSLVAAGCAALVVSCGIAAGVLGRWAPALRPRTALHVLAAPAAVVVFIAALSIRDVLNSQAQAQAAGMTRTDAYNGRQEWRSPDGASMTFSTVLGSLQEAPLVAVVILPWSLIPWLAARAISRRLTKRPSA